MSRCNSWRYVAVANHAPSHRPGQCRVCWVPCRERVDHRGHRCTECLTALSLHPDPSIRLALARSRGVDKATMETLVTDLDIHVSMAAQRALDDMGEDESDQTAQRGAVKPRAGRQEIPDEPADSVFSHPAHGPSVSTAVMTGWLTEEDER